MSRQPCGIAAILKSAGATMNSAAAPVKRILQGKRKMQRPAWHDHDDGDTDSIIVEEDAAARSRRAKAAPKIRMIAMVRH